MGDSVIVGLDIGTTKVRAAVGSWDEAGQLEITGVGVAPSGGLRRGVVVNIEATLKSVTQAIEAAELMSGREVHGVLCGIGGGHVEGINSRGVVAVTGRGREIAREDVERVIEAAKAVVIPMDREILHVIPQLYIVDDQGGVRNPVDMIGVRLEAEVHIITGSVTSAQNLVKCVNRAGFKVEGLVMESLAAARAVLTEDERDLGVLLLDMGGGTTNMLGFVEGAPCFTGVLPVGGAQVTNDLSILLNTPADIAEKIKVQAGCCWAPLLEGGEEVIVPGVGGRPPASIPREKIAGIMQPRLEELFAIAKEKIDKLGYSRKFGAGVVLTGGAAQVPGACELAHSVLGLPTRVGFPLSVGGLEAEYKDPSFATAAGLVLFGAEHAAPRSEEGQRPERKQGSSPISKLFDWFKREFF